MLSKILKNLIAGISTSLTAALIQNGLVQAQTTQTNPQGSSTNNVQKHIIQLAAPTLRTSEDMERDNVRDVNPSPVAIPFRPTINPATYQKLKEEAEAESESPRPKPSLAPNSNDDLTP